MSYLYDDSHLDSKYFIDDFCYNCPFCKRRHVTYYIEENGFFHSTNTRRSYYYLVCCQSCEKTSFHLSKYNLSITKSENGGFVFPPRQRKKSPIGSGYIEDEINVSNSALTELDDVFFYHMPNSFFTIDERIPQIIRESLDESHNCLKANFLTGASGCLRKAIYKFLQYEGIPDYDTQTDSFIKHNNRIELLKEKFPQVEFSLLDELKDIHMLTSQELHENDWADFDGRSLSFFIAVVKEILEKIYVAPDEARKRHERISDLKNKSKNKSKLMP